MTGYIYLSTCSVSNKVYVGMTIQKFYQRRCDHIKASFNEKNPAYNHHFHRAIRKYGKENFQWEILQTVEKETRKELIKELKRLEIAYIKKYNAKINGYNSTDGGDSSYIICKKIKVYLDTGELLDTLNDVTEASEKYNVSKNIIWLICGRFSYYTKWNNTRIIFRYENDNLTQEDLDKIQKINYDKPISQYDLSGNCINRFSNIKIAIEKLQIDRQRITDCCSGKTSFVLINSIRYIFKYGDDIPTIQELNYVQSIKSDPKCKVIAIDSVTNQEIGRFDSQSDASRVLGVRKNNISEACSGKRRTAGKYKNHPIKWIKQPIL